MSTKIMVGVDNRGLNLGVLAWLTERCNRQDEAGEIELITVTELGWVPVGGPEVNYRDAYELALWQAESTLVTMLPHVSVTTTMLWGLPYPELVKESARADLLVLGSDKTGVVIGLVFGTLPLRVAAHSHCPTVIVPAGYMPRPPHVVVGLSLEHPEDTILDFAGSEARRAQGRLTVVHAVPFPPNLLIADLLSDATYDAAVERSTKALGTAVDDFMNRSPDLRVNQILAKKGAVHGLVEAAAGASLLVIGARGGGQLRGLVLGSVSHDVLLNPPCPVAVIPIRQADR